MDSSTQVLTGRPFGGLSIVWKKSLGERCNIVNLGDSRLLGIEVDINGINAMFINMYMPCDCADNEDEFLMYLGKINDFIESYPTPIIISLISALLTILSVGWIILLLLLQVLI